MDDTSAARLLRLEAVEAVRKLKADYMQGLDDRLRGAVGELFWEDAIWESLPERIPEDGSPSSQRPARIVGRTAIAESFEAAAGWMSFTSHFLTNESISVDGDRASGQWKLLQACTAGETAFWQAGIYRDDFECRDGQWRFSHLRLALDFRTPYDTGWALTRMWDPATAGSRA